MPVGMEELFSSLLGGKVVAATLSLPCYFVCVFIIALFAKNYKPFSKFAVNPSVYRLQVCENQALPVTGGLLLIIRANL